MNKRIRNREEKMHHRTPFFKTLEVQEGYNKSL